jgi:hypothetical protein
LLCLVPPEAGPGNDRADSMTAVKPRIFMSTVMSELKSIRPLTANVLQGGDSTR